MITPLPPYPAALMRSQKVRTLVIADLHIGWEMALSQKGIHVATQTPKLAEKLVSLTAEYKPDRLLILGDVKHTIATAEMSEWHDIPDFFSELQKRVKETWVFRGNHDGNLEPMLPEGIRLLPATGMALGTEGFFHGHQWPSPYILRCRTLVMGHIHPVVSFRDVAGFRMARPIWVKAKCDGAHLARVLLERHRLKIENSPEETLMKYYGFKPKVLQLFIMPSFNDFLGGRPLNESQPSSSARTGMNAGPILRSKAVNMENAEIYLLDGTFLGTLDQLKTLS